MYKTQWSNLSDLEKDFLEMKVLKHHIRVQIKTHEIVGPWHPSVIKLSEDFFRYLGWYASEGNSDKNNIKITQSKLIHSKNWLDIIDLLNRLEFPSSYDDKKSISINSNVLKELTVNLCSQLACNKKIPFSLFTHNKARVFLETYFRGDGCWKDSRIKKYKKFSTASKQLRNDIVSLIGALGGYCSIKKDSIYRVTTTLGKKYRRKWMGEINFNGSTPVRIRFIEWINGDFEVYNLKSENGLFVSTHGIVVSN